MVSLQIGSHGSDPKRLNESDRADRIGVLRIGSVAARIGSGQGRIGQIDAAQR